MSLGTSIAAHLHSAVSRKTAFVVFATSAAVLLGALLTGAVMLVVLVFFYGFPEQAFFDQVGAAALYQLKVAGVILAAVGALSFASFLCGSCMLAASIMGARYRAAYLWFGIVTVALAALAGMRASFF